jgi:hypothetical protein
MEQSLLNNHVLMGPMENFFFSIYLSICGLLYRLSILIRIARAEEEEESFSPLKWRW